MFFFTLKGRKSSTSHFCLSGGLHPIIDLMINSRSTRISFQQEQKPIDITEL